MKVVLVLEKCFCMFKDSFCEAFEELDIPVVVFPADNSREYGEQRKKLMQRISSEHIDILLILNHLNREHDFFINEEIVQNVSCYVWFVDSLETEKIQDPCLNKYTKIFSFEPKDIPYAKKAYHLDIQYLPLTAGKSIFCSKMQQPTERAYDISFVGLAAGSEKRLRILNAAAEYCLTHHRTMAVYGHYWHNSHFFQRMIGSLRFKAKYPKLWPFIVNERVSPEKCAEIYRNSKINLNIHVPYHTGFNCRTFEILGNGNFELCDRQNTELIPFESGKHLVFYHTIEDLLEKIDYYLTYDEEREAIAHCGGAFVNERYSFADSLRVIFGK